IVLGAGGSFPFGHRLDGDSRNHGWFAARTYHTLADLSWLWRDEVCRLPRGKYLVARSSKSWMGSLTRATDRNFGAQWSARRSTGVAWSGFKKSATIFEK